MITAQANAGPYFPTAHLAGRPGQQGALLQQAARDLGLLQVGGEGVHEQGQRRLLLRRVPSLLLGGGGAQEAGEQEGEARGAAHGCWLLAGL